MCEAPEPKAKWFINSEAVLSESERLNKPFAKAKPRRPLHLRCGLAVNICPRGLPELAEYIANHKIY
jgi:hypothetical protein